MVHNTMFITNLLYFVHHASFVVSTFRKLIYFLHKMTNSGAGTSSTQRPNTVVLFTLLCHLEKNKGLKQLVNFKNFVVKTLG